MTYSIIKLSQLEGAKRIDVEFYHPEYLPVDKVIQKYENDYLGKLIIDFRSGWNLPQQDFKENCAVYIRTQNVRPILISKEGITCLPEYVKNYPKLEEHLRLKSCLISYSHPFKFGTGFLHLSFSKFSHSK